MKKTFLLIAGALMASGAFAEALTPEQALQRAAADGGRTMKATVQPKLTYTAMTALGQPAVYVFNQEGGGTLFLSADDVALPMLGYTDEGTFDPANIPPVINYWLGEYARQIEYALTHGSAPVRKNARQVYPTTWTYIAPMVKTKWDQGTPYNLQTPNSGSDHTPTGCVATATAQVMKYWNYPDVGQGKQSYSSNGRSLSMSFNQPFQWDKMLDTYVPGQYTDEEADAVSYLMKACGYGAKMQYAMGGSGTQTSLAGLALVEFFKYDSDIQYGVRNYYTDSEWTEIVYNQLKNVGPVIYDGTAPDGGHAFVVDGYDGNGYFHVNWGWGGICNGYYLLTALNPSQQGTGGSYGGYNYGQGMLYNIKKAEGTQHALKGWLDMYGNLSATASGSSLVFSLSDWNDPAPGFFNLSFYDFTPTFGIAVQKADGTGGITYVAGTKYTNTVRVGTYLGTNFRPTAGFPSSLGNGRYKVTLIYKDSNSTNSEWQYFHPIPGMYDYVYVTKNGNSLSIENMAVQKLKVTEAKIVSPLYYQNPCVIEFSISNPSDVELTQTIVPTLSVNGTVYYQSDSQLVAVGPGETVTRQLVYTFSPIKSGQTPNTTSPKEFTLGAYDYNTNTNYGTFGTVTMYRSLNNPKIALDEFSITNAQSSDGLYGISDFSNMQVQVSLSMTSNNTFVASPLTLVIYEKNTTGGMGAEVYEKEFENYMYLGSGETITEKTTLNFTDYSLSKQYIMNLYYQSGTSRVYLGSISFASTGVDEIYSESGSLRLEYNGKSVVASSEAGIASIEVYDAKGSLMVAADSETLDVSGLAGGLYIVRATDREGNRNTLKIVR